MLRYHIENFGCQMNDHDMEKARGLLHVAGFEATDDVRQADVVIVNTCCVREKAEQKFYSLMGRLKGLKRRKPVIIGVTGCIAQLEKDGLRERLPFIDFSLGPSSIHLIDEAVKAARDGKPFLDFSDNGCLSSLYLKPGAAGRKVKAHVTVMKGCNNFCTYCVVPYVRGREASRDSTDILQEIEGLASAGMKEVTLLGQNVNSYNKGRGDLSFPELLERINDIHGIERIRFVTSHPRDLSEDLVSCFGRLDKLCEQIHLPFQSGSNKILRLMNRGYSVEEYLEKIDALRARCRDIAISADCIVGFPGEKAEDFGATLALVEKVRFDVVFSFCFSPRKYTRASELSHPVPRDVASARLRELQTVQKVITRERFTMMEGSRVEVLVEGLSKNSSDELTGRTRTNHIVNFRGAREMIGKLVNLEITKGYANSLRGAQAHITGGITC